MERYTRDDISLNINEVLDVPLNWWITSQAAWLRNRLWVASRADLNLLETFVPFPYDKSFFHEKVL